MKDIHRVGKFRPTSCGRGVPLSRVTNSTAKQFRVVWNKITCSVPCWASRGRGSGGGGAGGGGGSKTPLGIPGMSTNFSERTREEATRSRGEIYGRVPLKEVVAECERRWFEATLKAAKGGDIAMQCLVGQMYCTGYGVASDIKKGKMWLQKSANADEDACRSMANMSVGRTGPFMGMGSEATPNDA